MTRQVAIIINVISVVLNAGFNIRFTYPVSLAFFEKTNEAGSPFLILLYIVMGKPELHETIKGMVETSENIKSNSMLLRYMTEVIHGTVHRGMIKPGDVLEENEEVLIIRVQKPRKSKIDIISKKPREMLNHSFVEEIIESTESGEGID